MQERRARLDQPGADQHQRWAEAQLPVGAGGYGWAGGVAVGGTEHLQLMGSRPALGVKLLARVEQKALAALLRWLPAVAAGPDPFQGEIGIVLSPEQQGTAFVGLGGPKHPLKNDQAMPT